MRNLFLHIFISADGYIEDAGGDIGWMSEDINACINVMLDSIDGMIFGRKAFELLCEFWPTAGKRPEVPRIQHERMHALPKYALSNSPEDGELAQLAYPLRRHSRAYP